MRAKCSCKRIQSGVNRLDLLFKSKTFYIYHIKYIEPNIINFRIQ